LWIEPIAGGRSNPTYLISGDDKQFVLRSRPPGNLLPSAHRIDREVRVLHALADSSVPVPRVLLFVDDPEPFGAPFYLMEWVPGIVVENPALPDLPAVRRKPSYHHAVDVIAALHRLDPAARGLADFGAPGDYNARQLKRWAAQLELSGGGTPMLRVLADRLKDAIPKQEKLSIVHGDYRFGNFLLDPTDGRIAAVLDWELSTLGDPFSDLAYLMLAYDLPRHGQILPGLKDVTLVADSLPQAGELIQRYCQMSGLSLPPSWPAYQALAFFRFAAISHGVLRRQAHGCDLTPDKTAQIESLAEIALSLLGRKLPVMKGHLA
jgi:aminoglycoside phosphotransferase (APT) family kinase protein